MLPCGAFASEQIVLLFSSHLVCLDSRPAPAPAGFFQCRWVFPLATAPPAPSRGRHSPAPDADLPSLFTIHPRHRGHRGHGLGSTSPAPETQEATRREASRLPLQGAPSPPAPRRGNRGHPSRAVPCGRSCQPYRLRSGGQVCAGQPCLYGPRRPLGREGPSSWSRRPPLSLEGGPSSHPPKKCWVSSRRIPRWAGKSGSRRGPLRGG